MKFNETEKEKAEVEAVDKVAPSHHVELDFSDDCEVTESVDDNYITPPDDEAPGPAEQPSRMSGRERRPPDYYGVSSYMVREALPSEPTCFEQAASSPEWTKAMETEMNSLHENNVWELVELPEGRKTVRSKWVYKVKTGVDGSIECYRVAQGFSQKSGVEYDETFCPAIRMESLRTFIASPPSQQPPFPERTLEHIKQEHQRFMEAGGNLKDAKKFHNCIAEPLFDIPIDNVSTINGVVKQT